VGQRIEGARGDRSCRRLFPRHQVGAGDDRYARGRAHQGRRERDYSYDESRDVFELAEACALDASYQDAVRAILIRSNDSVMGVSAKQREPICIPDLADAPDYALRDLTLSAGFHSLLVVPLLGQDEILGALVLQRRAAGDFPASVIGLMRTFA